MPKTLNDEQCKAVQYGEGPILVVAGAGTGKTTVITERIKYLILEKNIPPSKILALTFTDKAAREMEERVDITMPYGYTQMWISTFHAFCDRILKSQSIHIGLNPSYALLTEAESVLFLRKNIFKFKLNYFRPLGNPNKFLEGMLAHFSRLKDEDVSPNEYLNYAHKLKTKTGNKDEVKKTLELANAFKTYEELKTKEGVMDFSDLISNTLKLFRTRENILQIYQDQFEYILVDEFQDANFSQNQLAILLSGKKKNITVVGDDDQAIYRWRGAAISNIIQFRKQFPKSKVVTLTKNYRSTREILDSSYKLIQNNNPDRLEVKEKINKKLTSARNINGDKIEFLFAERVEDEAELVAQKIQELTSKQKNYKDIAILVRANDHSGAFARALERLKIPYQFLGPGQLFRQEEIKDLIAYLKVLYNFEDSASLYRVLTMALLSFDSKDVAAILNFARRYNFSLFEALENIDKALIKNETKEKINKFINMIKNHLKLVPKNSAGQILYYFLKDSNLLEKYISVKNTTDERKSQNIAKFFDKLKAYEAEHEDASIFTVVDWINLSTQMGESPLATNIDWSDNNAVNILTIHSSKGLEFKTVFLINLVTQRFPTRERLEQIPIPSDLIKEILPIGDYHLQEERRLFYVGMTRAKDNLFLTAANFYGEGKRERKISNFVYETLGQEYVENIIKKKKDGQLNSQLSLLEWDAHQIVVPTSTINNLSSIPITYLSYSQLQTFEICPLHYKLKYILKIPSPPTAAQSFGTSLHAALRDFYQKAIRHEAINIKDSIYLIEKNWIHEGYESKAHEKEALEKAKNVFINYIKNNYDPKSNLLPLGLELPFQFLLKKTAASTVGLKIGGRIDRVDELENNKIEVLDYKTGNNIPDVRSLSDNLQLTIYALAATHVNDNIFNRKPENVILSLYFLEHDKKITTSRSSEQLSKAKEFIMQKAEEIAKSDFKCSGSTLCLNCEYKMLCRV